MPSLVNRHTIVETERRIRPYIRHTPVVEVCGADFGLGCEKIHLKLELTQHSGSFKARGAFANLLMRDVPSAGVVAASGGNHGAAVAYAAHKLKVRAKIFVPEVSSPAKIARIRSYGADLVVGGERYADALIASEAWRMQSGAMAVHAFDQVAVGGGGLIGGIAAWFSGKVRIVAVEPEAAPTLHCAFAAGRPVDAKAGGIAADSLAPRRVGELVFPIAQQFVDRVVLVTDDAIAQAQRALWEVVRIVAEPGGAAAFSALLSGRYQPRSGECVGVLVSGGNTVAVDFDRRGASSEQ